MRPATVLLPALGVFACQDVTQLLVSVDSDQALTGVVVRVRPSDRPSGGEAHTFDPRGVGLPFSFGIAPPGNDAARSVRLEVDGVAGVGIETISQVLILPFLDGRTARFTVFLAGECRGIVCPAEETCALGGGPAAARVAG